MVEKYVLCRPRGGLNDTLNQIWKCYNYCANCGRTLVLDMGRSGVLTDFLSLFDFRSDRVNVVEFCREYEAKLMHLESVFPSSCSKRVLTYTGVYNRLKNYVDSSTNEPLRFDLEKLDYTQDLLIWEQIGGGGESSLLLRNLTFTKPVREHIKTTISQLPRSYSALHIRNTDYKTDCIRKISKIHNKLLYKELYIATDDHQILSDVEKSLPDKKIINFSRFRNTDSNPLHYKRNILVDIDKRSIMFDALTDLVILAHSDQLVILDIDLGFPSGFSRLAMFMRQRDTLDQLISADGISKHSVSEIRVKNNRSYLRSFVPKNMRMKTKKFFRYLGIRSLY